jgi:hypothetical protein
MAKHDAPRAGHALQETQAWLQDSQDSDDAHWVGVGGGGGLKPELLEVGSRLSRWCLRCVSLHAG